MSIQQDRLVIIDLESTCWKNKTPPPGQQSEIIEIGICLFDMSTQEPEIKDSIIVHPERSKISDFCTRLTSLTPDYVADHGIWFAEACVKLEQAYLTKNRIWASWGNYDLNMFQWQCKKRHVPYPFSTSHINIKETFRQVYGLKRRIGLAKAYDLTGLDMSGMHHRGDDDAWNIGRLVKHMLTDKKIDLFTFI